MAKAEHEAAAQSLLDDWLDPDEHRAPERALVYAAGLQYAALQGIDDSLRKVLNLLGESTAAVIDEWAHFAADALDLLDEIAGERYLPDEQAERLRALTERAAAMAMSR